MLLILTANIHGQLPCPHQDFGRLEAGPFARQMIYGGNHMEDWQYKDPLVLDMYKKMGGASVLLRHFARMHEVKAIYRQIEHCLREFKLNDPGTSSQKKKMDKDGALQKRFAVHSVTGSTSKMARSRTIRSSLQQHGMSVEKFSQ